MRICIAALVCCILAWRCRLGISQCLSINHRARRKHEDFEKGNGRSSYSFMNEQKDLLHTGFESAATKRENRIWLNQRKPLASPIELYGLVTAAYSNWIDAYILMCLSQLACIGFVFEQIHVEVDSTVHLLCFWVRTQDALVLEVLTEVTKRRRPLCFGRVVQLAGSGGEYPWETYAWYRSAHLRSNSVDFDE